MHLQEEVSLQPGPARPAPSSAPHSTPRAAVAAAGPLLRPHHSLGVLYFPAGTYPPRAAHPLYSGHKFRDDTFGPSYWPRDVAEVKC